MQSMDIDRNNAYRKRKTTDYEGNVYNPKVNQLYGNLVWDFFDIILMDDLVGLVGHFAGSYRVLCDVESDY